MRALLPIVALAGCYNPPEGLEQPSRDNPVPVLVTEDDGSSFACSPPRTVRVACAVDGDTVDLTDCGGNAERVRMLGVDAPETAKPGTPAECGADTAFAALRTVLTGQRVELTFDRDCEGVFGRTLAYVWLETDQARRLLGPDDVDEVLRLQRVDDEIEDPPVLLNAWMLWKGLTYRFDEAWVEPLREEATLVAAERIAKARGSGVWSACN